MTVLYGQPPLDRNPKDVAICRPRRTIVQKISKKIKEASDGDFEAVRKIAQTIKGPQIAGLSRANDMDIDRAWEALKYAGERGRIHTFIATSDIHMEHKLKMSEQQVLDTAIAAVKRAVGYTPNVEFSAEDAARTRLPFLAKVIEAVNAFFEDGENGFEREVKGFGEATGTEDFREGASAFIEKRKAVFKGK